MFYSFGHMLLCMAIFFGPIALGVGLSIYGLFKGHPFVILAAVLGCIAYYALGYFLLSGIHVQ